MFLVLVTTLTVQNSLKFQNTGKNGSERRLNNLLLIGKYCRQN